MHIGQLKRCISSDVFPKQRQTLYIIYEYKQKNIVVLKLKQSHKR